MNIRNILGVRFIVGKPSSNNFRRMTESVESSLEPFGKSPDDYKIMASIIDSISDSLVAVDKNWRLIFANQQARKHFSATGHKQLLGKSLWELLPQATEDTIFYQACHKVMRDKISLHYEAPSLITPGWFHFHIYPSMNGVSIFFSDVSKRRAAEAKLHESRKLFLTTFNASPYMKSIVRLRDLTYIDVNDTWVSRLKYQRDDVVGLHISQVPIMDAEYGLSLVDKLLRNGRIHNEEGLIYSKNNEDMLNVLISAVVAELENEQIIVYYFNDITELRKYQAELKRLDSLSLVGELASGISHEIRNPLTTVKGFLQILRSKEENSKYLDYYNIMIEELDRVNAILTEFLSLTKDKKVELKPANLTSIVESILPLLQSDAVGNDRFLEIDLKPVPDSLLDQNEIRQLLLNLVRNGFEATNIGGKVKIMTYQEGDQVVLAVADNGCGIPLEIQHKIGTPFFTTKEQGTGLGLSVCYRIADRHDAKMSFSTGTKGTTFYVKFKSI